MKFFPATFSMRNRPLSTVDSLRLEINIRRAGVDSKLPTLSSSAENDYSKNVRPCVRDHPRS